MMMVLAVPRSMAISCCKKLNNPMVSYYWGLISMFKMACTGQYHRHIVAIAIGYGFFIVYGTAGVNYGGNAGIMCNFHTIGEREKCIGCHYASMQIKSKGSGFFNRLFQCIYPRCLACSCCQQLFVPCQHNGI